MEKLKIKRRDTRKQRQKSVAMRVDISTYQKVEKAANDCNYSMIEMLDVLIDYAVANLEVEE